MRWDFSLRQRAEDRWQEARTWAEEQRQLRDLTAAPRTTGARPADAVASSHAGGVAGRIRRWVAGIAGFLGLVFIVLVAQAGAEPLVTLARHLAEIVLGPGTVKAVRFVDESQTLYIQWESATYRSGLAVPEARALLYGEAELATGAVIGRLAGVARIRFRIVQGSRALATGENRRGSGVWMTFGPGLGGGTMAPAPSAPSPGGSSLQKMNATSGARAW